MLVVAILFILIAAAQLEQLPEWAQSFPSWLQKTFFKVAVWQWLGVLALFVISAVAGYVCGAIVKRLLKVRDRFSTQPTAVTTKGAIERASTVIGAAAFSYIVLSDLALPSGFEYRLGLLSQSLLIIGTVLLINGGWDAICDTLASRATGYERAERLLIPMIRKLVRAVIIVGGVLAAVELYVGSKALTSLMATLGLGGLVMALAAKDSVENLFGSLTILFDMPFALGDWVKIDKVEGVVEEINLRSTRVRTFEDTVITLPNANLIRASVENFGSRRFRRQRLSLRLSYDCGPEAIDSYCVALEQWISEQGIVQSGQTVVELNDPSESSIGVLVQCFLEVGTFSEEVEFRHHLLLKALELRETHEVVFAAAPRQLSTVFMPVEPPKV